MATVHLICGLPCSGKTFFARKLAKESDALYLSLDETLTSLHGQYSIDEIGHSIHVERVISARLTIWNVAQASLSINVPVVLDDGFFLRQTRDRYRNLCSQASATPVLYLLDTPINKIRERLPQRNTNLPKENFLITTAMLEQMVEIFEAPSEDEAPIIVNDSGIEQKLPPQSLP